MANELIDEWTGERDLDALQAEAELIGAMFAPDADGYRVCIRPRTFFTQGIDESK